MRIALLLALISVAGAADAPPGGLRQPLPPPKISVPDAERPVELAQARYEVVVHGVVAETTATFTFRNPNQRPLEGTLEVPLPDGATVCGYALDIGGRLVDAVVVGRDQGRLVIETESRRRVDPGLVEQVVGNAFRTRIFPLPANGTRTARLTWACAVAVQAGDAALRVPLPRCPLPSLDLRVEIAGGEVEPRLEGFGNLTLTRWRSGRVAEAHFADQTPGDDLIIRLPGLAAASAQVESSVDERFVAIAATAPARPPAAVAQPERIAIAWDASGSRTDAGIALGRAALAELARRWPGTTFDLVVFRDVAAPAIACADGAALDRALGAVVYDGGTAFAALDLRRAALPDRGDAAWIVVGDGIGTLGAGLPACDDVPVHALLVEPLREAELLRALAARTGGLVVDAAGRAAADAAGEIVAPPPRLLRVGAGGAGLADVEIVDQGARCLVLARALTSGDVDLVFDTGTVRAAVRLADAVPGEAVARAWAGRTAARLSAFPDDNAARIVELGRRYGIVTPGTSLLVLESLDQYLRHGIEPPASWPELRAQYGERLKQRGQEFAVRGDAQLERVVGAWQQQIAWWEGKGPRPQPGEALREGAPPAPPATARPALRDAAAPRAATAAPVEMALEEEAKGREEGGDTLRSIGAGSAATGQFGARAGGGRQRAAGLRGGEGDGGIAIAAFDPTTPYLTALRAAAPAGREAEYLHQRAGYRASPSFFLDCAAYFAAIDAPLARRILSNLAELRVDDPALLRIYAWRARAVDDQDTAVRLLRRVARLRPEEPQSYRDLAIALAERGEARGRADDVEEAMRLQLAVVLRRPTVDAAVPANILDEAWNRFPGIEVITLEELNRLIVRAGRGGFDRAPAIPELDPRLRKVLDVDLRVVMAWDLDATDIDLHVTDPSREVAFYGHRFTAAGGMVSLDCTSGYGPEEYEVRAAAAGTYDIRCHYFGSRSTALFGAATVVATVYRDWGRATERRETMLLRLDHQGEALPVGSVRFGADAGGKPVAPAADTAPTRDAVAGLRLGMTRAEVEAALGSPQRVDGAGTTVLVYALRGGGTARIGLAPGVLYAREELDGAERDLLRPR